jgi:hypothetical protein
MHPMHFEKYFISFKYIIPYRKEKAGNNYKANSLRNLRVCDGPGNTKEYFDV